MNSQPIVQIKSYAADALMSIRRWKPTCLEAARKKETPEFQPLEFVVEFEEKELHELQDPASQIYSVFLQRFQRVATAAQVNLFIFIGHSDICLNYVDLILKDVTDGTLAIPNSLPSVILIIGCKGQPYLDKYRAERNGKYKLLHEKQFHFFGFENLVHIYKGDIYNCQKPHLATPKLRCAHLPTEKHEECCTAKEGSFHRLFLEYLNKRNCTKISDEALIDRFRSIGSSTFKGYIFGARDGKSCEETDPCVAPSQNQINSNKKSKNINALASNYDDAWFQLYQETRYLSQQHIIDVYKNLPKERAVLLSHEFSLRKVTENGNTHFFDSSDKTVLGQALVHGQYEVVLYLISQTKHPISFRYSDLISMRSAVGKQGIKNDPGEDPQDIDEEKPRLQAWQYYNYLTMALKKDPAFFTTMFTHPDYPELQTTGFYEYLSNVHYGFEICFFYSHFKNKLPLDESGYVDISKLTNEKDFGNMLALDFDRKPESYHHLRWCLAMKFNPNQSSIQYKINLFLRHILDAALEENDQRSLMLLYLIAFGYNHPSVIETIKELSELMDMFMNIHASRASETKKMKKAYLDKLLQMIEGSGHFDPQVQTTIKQQLITAMEDFIRKTEQTFRFRDNLPARLQFPSLMGQLSQSIKRKPLIAREAAYDVAKEIIQNADEPEHIRLQKLEEQVDRFKPAPSSNTTAKGGKRKRFRRTRKH